MNCVIAVKRMSLHRLLNKASLSSDKEGHGRAFWSEREEEERRRRRWAVDELIMVKAG